MSTHWNVVLLLSLLIALTYSQSVLRDYVVEKDFFSGIKAGEFTIYDGRGQRRLYRLESRYSMSQSAELIAYPSKFVAARIKNPWLTWVYQADIQVFDDRYNQWISGRIFQSFPNYRFRYTIQYGDRRLTMENSPLSLTAEIRDEQYSQYVLARIRTKLSSFVWSNKYDLQVFTNDLPDAIYLLALAAWDYNRSLARSHTENNRKWN